MADNADWRTFYGNSSTGAGGSGAYVPPPNANNTFDPAAYGQSPTQQSWSTVGSGYPPLADLGYRNPALGPVQPTGPGGVSRGHGGAPGTPGRTPDPLPGPIPTGPGGMRNGVSGRTPDPLPPDDISSTSSALTSSGGVPGPTALSAPTFSYTGLWGGGGTPGGISSTSSALTSGGGGAPASSGALPEPKPPNNGALSPVYDVAGKFGLDPGSPNRDLAAGLQETAKAAQQSAYDQRQYTANALSQTEGSFNPAIAAYQGAYGQGGSLTGPGALEQFAAQDAAGTNPYYNQMMQEGLTSVDQSFNAGGNYGSGARLAARSKFASNLDAQHYQQQAQLQGQAQAAKEGRINTGFSSGLGLGTAQSGIAATMYGQGSKAYADMISAALAGNADAQKAMAQSGADQQKGILSTAEAFF